jgi:hypothetical protein
MQNPGPGNEAGCYGYRMLEGNTGSDLIKAIRARLTAVSEALQAKRRPEGEQRAPRPSARPSGPV